MVYELRAGMHGDVIVLGASSWRVADIGPNRVTVTPAPGVPGKLPFWKGDTVGRPVELGRAHRCVHPRGGGRPGEGRRRGGRRRPNGCGRTHDLDDLAAENLLSYLEDEREADRRPAHRHPDRHRALPRRAGRLAARRADAVRRPGPRAVDAGDRGADRGAARVRGPDHLLRRRDRDPAARGRVERRRRSRSCCSRTRTRSRTWSSGGSASRACSRAGSARTPRGRCCSRGDGPGRGPRSGSSASGPRTCWRWRRATGRSRSSSRRTASASPTCSTCRRCASCWAASSGAS